MAKKRAATKNKASTTTVEPVNGKYQQELFCQMFVSGETMGNATRSYLAAGYETTEQAARANASRLIANDSIRQRIAVLQAEQLCRLQITGDALLSEMSALAFSNVADLLDDDGNLIPANKLPRHVAASITEVKHKYLQTNGESVLVEITYKVGGKKSALDTLLKVAGMIVDHVKVEEVESPYMKALQDQAAGSTG